MCVIQIKEYTWAEVSRHAEYNDKWLVIDGQVYNISSWSKKHPGGSRLISHYAGQDATVSAYFINVCNVYMYIYIST